MRSLTLVSEETLDGEDAALDLLRQLESFTLDASSCALVFTEPGYDYDEALRILREKRPDLPILGATSLAQLSPKGYRKLGLTMLVLTANDCTFSVAGAGGLDENGPDKMRNLYAEALAGLGGEEPSGAIIFSNLTEPYNEQDKLALLDELIGHKPVIGGIASDNFTFTERRVFVNDTIYEGGFALLLIAGNFKPIVRVGGVPNKGLPRYRITGSSGTTLTSVDDTPVIDFLTANNVDLNSTVGLLFAPFSAIEGDTDEGGPAICRPLISVDKEKGTARSYVDMPQGSMASFQIISAADLKETVEKAAGEVMEAVEAAGQNDYEYSTVLCVTCAGRHAVLAFEHEYESTVAAKYFSSRFQYAGFYAFTEIGPTFIDNANDAKNHTHNLSVIFCAF